jgi:hypothetical protein
MHSFTLGNFFLRQSVARDFVCLGPRHDHLLFPYFFPPRSPDPELFFPLSRLIRYDENDLPDSTPKLSRSAQRKKERMQGLGVKLRLPGLEPPEGVVEEGGEERE